MPVFKAKSRAPALLSMKSHTPKSGALPLLVVMIPAFNEETTIQSVIASIPKQIPGITRVQVVVIDDGSKDNTAALAMDAGAIVISNARNQGLAFTFRKGLMKSLELGADIIVNTDADNQYDQAEIPALIEPILAGNADMVLGSRFKGYIESMPFSKKLGNRLATLAVKWVSGADISDGQTGFRAFTRDAAMRLNISSNFTYTQETILEAADKGFRMVEIPATFRKRSDKNRLFNGVFDYAKRAGSTLIMGYLNYHPMKAFVGMGSIIILVGLISGSRVIIHFLNTGQVNPYLPSAVFTAVCVIVGVQIAAMGLIATMLKHNRKLLESQLLELKMQRLNNPKNQETE